MKSESGSTQRRELAEFVRAHRERLAPDSLGLPARTRRRTPGLRREEMAQLCGMSVTWYTWIEQGRDVSVSPAALGRIAEKLRLSRAERNYLFALANKRDPTEQTLDESWNVPPALAASIQSIATPAYLLDSAWNALAWNPPAARLFVGWLDGPGERNLLRYIFLDPVARKLVCDWEDRARRVVAEFRVDYSRNLDEPKMRALVDELMQRSAAFAQWWDEHAVIEREGGARTFDHPQDGFQRYEQVTFNMAAHPELKLVMLTKFDGA
jgi:transcriptional regulator with XRE-family HTH domain